MNSDNRIRVLLVDDEEGYLDVLSKRMTRRNLRVMTAYSGEAAIRALRRYDFDVALVDLKMQDMDGIELLKIFKKMVPELTVIILTGHGSEIAAKEGMEHGAYDYLTKPFDFEELLEKIHQARLQTKSADQVKSDNRRPDVSEK